MPWFIEWFEYPKENVCVNTLLVLNRVPVDYACFSVGVVCGRWDL